MERGAYTALLDQYYAREAPLPLERDEIYRLAAANSAAERKAVDYVVGRYFTQEDDGWHQKRCDAELASYHERSASARESAQARWSKRNADAMRSHSDGNANQKPVTSNHKPEDQEQSARTRASTRKPPAKRLPDDWSLPEDWGAWALQERPDWTPADALRVSLLFRDHWAGKGEARADWLATWRNWVRRERGHSTGPPRREPTLAERRTANLDVITGKAHARDISSTASRVDSPTVRALPVGVREQDGDDVGSLRPGGPVANVG